MMCSIVEISQWQGSVSAVSSLSEAWKSISTHLAPSTRHFPLAQVGSFNRACQAQMIHDHSNANTKSASLSYFKATSFGASFSSTSQHRIPGQTSLEPTKSHKKSRNKYKLRRWPAGSKENCYQSLWPQKIEHRENAKATWQHQPTFFFDSERPFDLRILNLRDGALHLGKLGKSTKSQVNHQVNLTLTSLT